ncbi:MAG: hypothetical protein FWC77_02800 [Defluviitaleaceae bacterium]|nr:hypothetical protein [Defluviitaleaceae bacterium]
MSKRKIRAIIILFAVLVLAACSSQSNHYYYEAEETDVPTTELTAAPEPEPTTEPEPQALTWQEAYAALLREYAELPPVTEWATRGFILYDIDKNGTPELIITRKDEDFFDIPDSIRTEAIYTFRYGEVLRLQGEFFTNNSAFAPSGNQPGIVVHCGLRTHLLVIEGNRLVPKHMILQPWYWDDDRRWFTGPFMESTEITEEEYIELSNSFVPAWAEGELSERSSIWPADITEDNIYNIVFGTDLPEFIIHIADFIHLPPVVTVQATDEIHVSAGLLTGQRFRDEFMGGYDSHVFFSDYDGFGDINDVLEYINSTHTSTQLVSFTVNAPVRNFRYLRTNGAEIVYEISDVLHTQDILLPDTPFITTWWAAGPFSQFGISFEDERGVTRYFALNWDLRGYHMFAFYEFEATAPTEKDVFSFSYIRDIAMWADSPRAVRDGFSNTDVNSISNGTEAFYRAKNEDAITIPSDSFTWQVRYDPENAMWRVQLGSWYEPRPAYTVFMNSDGITTLIIDFSE